MYKVIFYSEKSGKEPVKEYILDLARGKDKNSRIILNKIQDYIEILRTYGTQAGEPYIKHLDGDIWELRPKRERILFAGLTGNVFVLLHCFVKRTQKTPKKEIDKAKRCLAEILRDN